MPNPESIARNYLLAWNETDPEQRAQMLREGWAEDARYVDPIMSGEGRAQIAGLIGAVHERFAGFRFALLGKPDGHGDHVRFSWSLGPAGADLESLALAELVVRVEDHFGVKFDEDEVETLAGMTVGEFCRVVAPRIQPASAH